MLAFRRPTSRSSRGSDRRARIGKTMRAEGNDDRGVVGDSSPQRIHHRADYSFHARVRRDSGAETSPRLASQVRVLRRNVCARAHRADHLFISRFFRSSCPFLFPFSHPPSLSPSLPGHFPSMAEATVERPIFVRNQIRPTEYQSRIEIRFRRCSAMPKIFENIIVFHCASLCNFSGPRRLLSARMRKSIPSNHKKILKKKRDSL